MRNRRPALRTLGVLLTSAMLVACTSLAPAFDPLGREMPPSFKQARDYLLSDAPNAQGWRALDDERLAAQIDRALRVNSDVVTAVARLDAARASLGLARAGHLPNGGIVASRTDRSFSAHQAQGLPSGARASADTSLTLDAAWEIDLFGRVRSATGAAQAELVRAHALHEAARISVAAEVVATWYALRAAHDESAVRVRYRADQEQIVVLTRALLAEGGSAEAALAAAEAELATDRIAESETGERIGRLTNALAVLTGTTPGTRQVLPSTSSPLRFAPLAVGDPASLLARRPDVRAAAAEYTAAGARVGEARTAWFPRLDLVGSIGWVAGGVGGIGDDDARAWTAGPVLRWSLLDLGRTGARVDAATAATAAARARYERTVLEALRDADDAFTRYHAAHSRLNLATVRLEHTRRVADAAQQRYAAGASDYRAALEARRDSLDAELGAIQALAEHRLAVLGVLKALGTDPAGAADGKMLVRR